ncbi:MAG: T9SS C-terminal target domain-containing protein [Ignavibacteriales bacterium]|nr:MAG: T9SS C-terminal target domain-containing protein [Ignavibacteriales bacterium]
MKNSTILKINVLFFLIIAFYGNVFAINELDVKVPDVYISKPGYIDKAVLVVEPHGSYSEQSLYLEYSDRGQFNGYNQVEVIHRFELPEGAVINDMWLWIGDSVMQAIMLDTWTARSIYDSIVSMKRDPAFLSKVGDQYELHIFPLTPGGIRKIKMNYIVPSKWIGNLAIAEFPFDMLASNNSTQKPLEVLYRYREDVWGNPSFLEDIPNVFEPLKDTLGFHYLSTRINDISGYSSLNLVYQTKFNEGFYFDSYSRTDKPTYFEFGIETGKFFNLSADSSNKNVMLGIDLSGNNNMNMDVVIPNIKKVLHSALKPNDKLKVLVSGAGKIKSLTPDFIDANVSNVDNLLNDFSNSTFADSIKSIKLPYLVYCDVRAIQCWHFSKITSFLTYDRFDYLTNAVQNFHNADIIAAYSHGYEDPFSTSTFQTMIQPALDSFFVKGGRFLSYYDYNREFAEVIGKHYINGLSTKKAVHESITLYRNTEGNIGNDFPEKVDHAGTYFFNYNDPDVKVELRDKDGNAAVISKRIGKGLIIISGMWSLNDDDGLKAILSVGLMGLNSFTKSSQQLQNLLTEISTSNNIKDSVDKCLIISNADSLITETDATSWVNNYLSSFTKKPVFNSINLLDGNEGLPSYLTVDLEKYYGSGYLLSRLSESTNGLHYESYKNDWDYMASSLSAYSLPNKDSLNISIDINEGTGTMQEIREVSPVKNDVNKPIFHIGSSTNALKYKFNISAKFNDSNEWRHKTVEIIPNGDTTKMGNIIPTMLGNEKLNDLFRYNSTDTAAIISLALRHNILCDYTALIALEPNDTLHFMKDPFDEGGMTEVENEIKYSDSLFIDIYPNPFNMQTTFLVNVSNPSFVSLIIYNILGQQVAVLSNSDLINESRSFRWNGKGNFNQYISTGIYIAQVVIKEVSTNKTNIISKKLLLVK